MATGNVFFFMQRVRTKEKGDIGNMKGYIRFVRGGSNIGAETIGRTSGGPVVIMCQILMACWARIYIQ